MSEYRIEKHNLDGRRLRRCRVYPLTPDFHVGEYWPQVTDRDCPICRTGIIRWAEAGYVPGYRMCDSCGRHFQSSGNVEAPALILIGGRRHGPIWKEIARLHQSELKAQRARFEAFRFDGAGK